MWDVANECGNPILGSPEEVEGAAEWPGRKDTLFFALKDLRWIDALQDGRWVVHNYWHHAPKYVKNRRYMEEKRQCHGDYIDRNQMLKSDCKDDSSIDNGLRSDSGPQSPTVNEKSPTPAPAPAPGLSSTKICSARPTGETLPDPKPPGQGQASGLQEPDNPRRQEPAMPASPTAMTFPVKSVGKGQFAGKREWPLTEAKIAEYSEAFPDLDVPALLRFIRQWCIDTPPKRKTFGGMTAFITRWMGREMDKAHSRFRRDGVDRAPPGQDEFSRAPVTPEILHLAYGDEEVNP